MQAVTEAKEEKTAMCKQVKDEARWKMGGKEGNAATKAEVRRAKKEESISREISIGGGRVKSECPRDGEEKNTNGSRRAEK